MYTNTLMSAHAAVRSALVEQLYGLVFTMMQSKIGFAVARRLFPDVVDELEVRHADPMLDYSFHAEPAYIVEEGERTVWRGSWSSCFDGLFEYQEEVLLLPDGAYVGVVAISERGGDPSYRTSARCAAIEDAKSFAIAIVIEHQHGM